MADRAGNAESSLSGRRALAPQVEVPCRLLLTGLQVARVIGKNGVLIKELREESGAVVNVLDKQLPVAFANRDERVVIIRGTPDAIQTAVSGIVRLAFGPVVPGEEHLRSVEVMTPEAACAHLIGDKGAQIAGIMDETKCYVLVVSEPVSGLLEQKRVRITGPTLRDVGLAIWRVQEVLFELARSGVLAKRHFDMREGPSAQGDFAPQERRIPSSTIVAMLISKDESAWIIGKGGNKINRLRERARVAVNDAEVPPFRPNEAVLEIGGASLRELIYVLQLVIEDLGTRQTSSNTTRFLLPTEHFGAVLGQGGQVITRISEQSGATLHQQPAERKGNGLYPLRVIEATGTETERTLAAEALYVAIEEARAQSGNPTAKTSQTPQTSQDFQSAETQAALESIPPARVQSEVEHSGSWRPLSASAAAAARPAPHWSDTESSLRPPAYPARHQVEPLIEGSTAVHSPPPGSIATSTTLFLLMPTLEVARFLASPELGLARRTGSALTSGTGASGEALLRLCGPPAANAVACFLVQEALWMTGAYGPVHTESWRNP